MEIKDLGDKTYNELSNNEIALFDDSLDKLNLNLEKRNNIFVRLLFGLTLKESVITNNEVEK